MASGLSSSSLPRSSGGKCVKVLKELISGLDEGSDANTNHSNGNSRSNLYVPPPLTLLRAIARSSQDHPRHDKWGQERKIVWTDNRNHNRNQNQARCNKDDEEQERPQLQEKQQCLQSNQHNHAISRHLLLCCHLPNQRFCWGVGGGGGDGGGFIENNQQQIVFVRAIRFLFLIWYTALHSNDKQISRK